MKKNFSRREFILTGTAAFSGFAALGSAHLLNSSLSKSDTIRVGLIGLGSRGSGIANVLQGSPGIELAACCDIIPKRLQKGMKLAANKAKAYADYHDLLNDKNIHAVIIATPLNLHYQMASDAIEAGKHIYMEKTMTYDIPQAQKLVQKVQGSNLIFQVGHQYRYYGLYHKIHEILSQDWCGHVSQIECQYHRNGDWRRPVSDPKMERQINWRMYREYSGGLMAELCAHQIDIVNWMLGSTPVKVAGFGGIDYWKDGRETYDNVRTVYEYPNGVKSSVSSVLTNAYKGYSIRILGTKATLEIQREKAFLYPEAKEKEKERGIVDGVSGATIQNWTQGDAIPIEFKKVNHSPTVTALLDFADCIRNDRKPFSNEETGRDAAIAVHLGNLAMREGKVQLWKPEYSMK